MPYSSCSYTHTRARARTRDRFMAFVWVYPGEPIPEETSIHSHPSCWSTILIIFLHLPQTTASSLLNLSAQPLTMASSAYLWVWSPLLHIPYTSSPNHYHPYATHVHTIVACFAVVATLCPLFTMYLLLMFSTDHNFGFIEDTPTTKVGVYSLLQARRPPSELCHRDFASSRVLKRPNVGWCKQRHVIAQGL